MFNSDVKHKSYGFFDVQYVQPQYHIEKFHSDEKHANAYEMDDQLVLILHLEEIKMDLIFIKLFKIWKSKLSYENLKF